MSEVTEGILKRIQALLAMSRGNANENEAAVAAAKAQELLAKYNLELADVEKRDVRGKVIEDGDLMTSSSNPWRRDLAYACARLYFCDYWWTHKKFYSASRKTGYIRGDQHNFIGLPHNVVVAKEMFVYLVDTVERLAKESRRAGQKRGDPIDGTWNMYEHAFRHGCAMRLVGRIWQKYKEQTEPPAGLLVKSNLPVLYKGLEAEVQEFVKANRSDLVVRKPRGKQSSVAGVRDGNRAAEKISLDTQIGTESPVKQIGGAH